MARFRATAEGNIPFTPEEEAERDAEEAAWAAGENDRLAAAAREKRDALLAACDWRVVKAMEDGSGLNFELAAYRQALRDIPQQPGFPVTIVWPEAP
jgi:DMSO/TMAO reductase YedYZ molybdopterin-dependent catalytic subunit